MNKIIGGIIAGTVVLVLGTVLLASKMSNAAEVSAADGVKTEIGETSYDWGEIGINGGNVEKDFVIKNSGDETLKIFNVATSCMCTSAQFVGEKSSPIFGMHTKSSYVEEIAPGEEGTLRVTFDPAYHGPSGVGPITRQVEMMTNDPEMPKIDLTLTAVVRGN